MSDELNQDEINELLKETSDQYTEGFTEKLLNFNRDFYRKESSVLQKAFNIVYKDRIDQYGKPEDNFKTIGSFWSTYLTNKFNIETPITTEDVAIMMILLKVARETSQHKRDNLIDIAGYVECADRIYNRE